MSPCLPQRAHRAGPSLREQERQITPAGRLIIFQFKVLQQLKKNPALTEFFSLTPVAA